LVSPRDVGNDAVGTVGELAAHDAHDLDAGAAQLVVLAAVALEAVAR
jgi:hypothetical protein